MTTTLTIKIPEENRSWGFNPAPDGTEVEFLSFCEISYGHTGNFGREPGIYENRRWLNIRLPDGKEMSIYSGHVEGTEELDLYGESKYLRPLPKLPFFEGDIVEDDKYGHGKIIGIQYLDNPITYQVDLDTGGYMYWSNPDTMHLVESGNVWRYYHNEPLEFESIQAEAEFYISIGHSKEVQNPRYGLYYWPTMTEVLESLKEGLGDCVTGNGGLFGSSHSLRVLKFRDENLGNRIREVTLNEFKDFKEDFKFFVKERHQRVLDYMNSKEAE